MSMDVLWSRYLDTLPVDEKTAYTGFAEYLDSLDITYYDFINLSTEAVSDLFEDYNTVNTSTNPITTFYGDKIVTSVSNSNPCTDRTIALNQFLSAFSPDDATAIMGMLDQAFESGAPWYSGGPTLNSFDEFYNYIQDPANVGNLPSLKAGIAVKTGVAKCFSVFATNHANNISNKTRSFISENTAATAYQGTLLGAGEDPVPVANATIVWLSDKEDPDSIIARTQSNQYGEFAIDYNFLNLPDYTVPTIEGGMMLFDQNGNIIKSSEGDEVFDITIPPVSGTLPDLVDLEVPSLLFSGALLLDAEHPFPGFELSEDLKDWLAAHAPDPISTLGDVRTNGGISNELSDEDPLKAEAERLDAHAYLEIVSEFYYFNNRLITAGIKSISDITNNQRNFFTTVEDISSEDAEEIGDFNAASVYENAIAVEYFLTNQIINWRIDNGY